MNVARLLSLALLSAALLPLPVAATAAESAHHHHDARDGTPMLDHGKPWATDAALREGMSAMRTALAAQHANIHDNTLDAAGYASLAASLKSALAGIFAQCRLPPAADAQLHNVLLPMNAAIERMKDAGTVQEQREAALAVMRGLEDYARTFDHPGWQPL